MKRDGIKRNREICHWYGGGGVRKRDTNFEAVKSEVSIRKSVKGAQHEMQRSPSMGLGVCHSPCLVHSPSRSPHGLAPTHYSGLNSHVTVREKAPLPSTSTFLPITLFSLLHLSPPEIILFMDSCDILEGWLFKERPCLLFSKASPVL